MCCFWSISILVIFTSGFKTFLVFNPWSLMPNHRRKGASWCVDSQFLGCATRVQCGFLHVWSWYFRRLLRFKHFPNRHPMTNAYLKKALNLGSMKSFSEGDVIPIFFLITKLNCWYRWLTYERRGMSAPSRKITYLKPQIVHHVA